MQAIQTNCPWLLRYLVTAIILTKVDIKFENIPGNIFQRPLSWLLPYFEFRVSVAGCSVAPHPRRPMPFLRRYDPFGAMCFTFTADSQSDDKRMKCDDMYWRRLY